MNKEFIFRGKNEKTGEWVYGSYYDFELSNATSGHYIIMKNGTVYPVDPETVGPYIGLSDKNDKKIFDGDIVSIYDYTKALFVISFMNFSWMCVNPVKEGYHYYQHRLDDNSKKYKIVGNIYDNPELLM